LTDDDYRALVEQAHQVSELTRHPGWAVLLDYLRFSEGALAKRQVQVLQGGARSFDDYQNRIGWIQGVQYAIDAPDRLEKQVQVAAQNRAAVEDDGA